MVRLQTAWTKSPTYSFPPLTLIVFDFDNINMMGGAVALQTEIRGTLFTSKFLEPVLS